MSIHLSVQADDPEVEELLIFIRTRFSHLEIFQQRQMAERAAKWLEATEELFFRPNSAASVLEVDHAPASLVP